VHEVHADPALAFRGVLERLEEEAGVVLACAWVRAAAAAGLVERDADPGVVAERMFASIERSSLLQIELGETPFRGIGD